MRQSIYRDNHLSLSGSPKRVGPNRARPSIQKFRSIPEAHRPGIIPCIKVFHYPGLEPIEETDGDHRVIFQSRQLIVELSLLSLNVALDPRLSGDIAAVCPAKVACVSAKIELGTWCSLENNTQVEHSAEMSCARNKIAPSEHSHRRGAADHYYYFAWQFRKGRCLNCSARKQ